MDNEKLEILKILIENKEMQFSIRKLAKLRKINYKSAYNAISKLLDEGNIECKKIGNTTICSFNYNFNESVFLVEYERRNILLKDKNIKVLYGQLKKLNFPFIALIFGSYAKKSQTKHSDIDILTITEHEKEINAELSILPLKSHHTSITYKEFLDMAKSKESKRGGIKCKILFRRGLINQNIQFR